MVSDVLDIEQPEALLAYLRAQGYIASEEQPRLQRLSGGVSNRTVLVERPSGEQWVIKQALDKLRVAVDWYSSPERIHSEAAGLRWLQELAPTGTVPDLIFEDHQHHLLAMAAVPQPHQNWKVALLASQLNMDHVRQFGQILATIHRRSYERRAEVAEVFAERRFFESLRLEPYYQYTSQQVPEAAPFIEALIESTRLHREALVHGDYSPKNILVYQNRLILLDHEVIHWGDPAFDLGFSLTHLLSKAHHLPNQRLAFTDAALTYWQVYRQTLGQLPWTADLESRAIQHTLACLLARVDGRSPLEYFSAAEQTRQRQVVLSMMAETPQQMADLVGQFIRRLNHAHH
jgi:aminoglycoside phosphotransferase (APT) family kinase protein